MFITGYEIRLQEAEIGRLTSMLQGHARTAMIMEKRVLVTVRGSLGNPRHYLVHLILVAGLAVGLS